MSGVKTMFKCVVCGKLTAGRLPRASGWFKGDGSCYYPRRHKVGGVLCPGSLQEAEWVNVPTPSPLPLTDKESQQ